VFIATYATKSSGGSESSGRSISVTRWLMSFVLYACISNPQVDVDASISGGYGGFSASASFSASRGSQSFANNIATTTETRYTVTSYCTNFKVAFTAHTDFSKQKLVPAFEAVVKTLPGGLKDSVEEVNEVCDLLFSENLVDNCNKDTPEKHELFIFVVRECTADEKKWFPDDWECGDYKDEVRMVTWKEECPIKCAVVPWYGYFKHFGTCTKLNIPSGTKTQHNSHDILYILHRSCLLLLRTSFSPSKHICISYPTVRITYKLPTVECIYMHVVDDWLYYIQEPTLFPLFTWAERESPRCVYDSASSNSHPPYLHLLPLAIS